MKKLYKRLVQFYNRICDLDSAARALMNKDHLAPSFPEIYDMSKNPALTGWFLMAPWLNMFHDDNENLPEIKFTNIDGREYIYGPIGDHFDSAYVFQYGSFNYCSTVTNKTGWRKWAIMIVKYVGHFILDIFPSMVLRKQ